MAEEFQQAGLCGGGNYYWWNNTTSWPTDMERRTRSSCDEDEATGGAASGSDTCLVLRDVQKPNDSSDGLLLDSTLQMMGFGLSSDHWNQPNHLLRGSSGGGGEGGADYNSMLLQDMDSSVTCHQIQRDWTSPPKSFSSEEDEHSPSNQDLNNTFLNTSAADDNSYVDANNYSGSTMLFEPDHPFNNRYSSSSLGTRTTSLNEPFLQQQEAAAADSSLHLSNNTPFWNASLSGNTVRASFFSPQSQFEEKPDCSGLFASRAKTEQVGDSPTVVKRGNTTSDQPAFKRPRIETPSPLPTFKVRKEKLGDRITALQQLVSPFGKTDTASVLHEAIEYIKFLHDQVSVLSTPYMKNGAPLQHQQASADHHQYNVVIKDRELAGEAKQDLRSRGLCLVPISSTFPVANETTADFWTPTFGATFR